MNIDRAAVRLFLGGIATGRYLILVRESPCTSFQDLRRFERIKGQRFQEVKEAGSIFAEFGTPG